ncbi:hypothetical protein AMK06_CH02306 [Rhizobium sp. N541]|uniref:hypothetical protein n=1 Tax=unclassified Rhizobium TaxID=2613769 RepID=UPI0007EE78F8|nr:MULTISPECIES: hypothetical protein [unclassified Rhizobium]ANM17200.1 hypothetical protein AMK06_CH02306 [Rhizobium sp. N541]ANM23585.1 hypothetical protein AMK07_CH02303 [Rhizobium sp. N941]
MAIGELIWNGRAWPKAFVSKTVHIIYKEAPGGPRSGTNEAFEIQTTGKGREYEETGAAAWWRNFSELDLANPDAVIEFVRRRGDPFGELSPRDPTDTGQWQNVTELLKPAAACWDGHRSGTSVYGNGKTAPAEHRSVVDALLNSTVYRQGITYTPSLRSDGDLSIQMKASNLAAFMVASAVLQMARQNTCMAICQQCGDWFEQLRTGTKFCSPSCRAAYSTSTRERK